MGGHRLPEKSNGGCLGIIIAAIFILVIAYVLVSTGFIKF